MAHIGKEFTLGMVGPVRNLLCLTQELAFFRLPVNHEQIRADESEQKQHQDARIKNHSINIGYTAGNSMPGNIADEGTAGLGQIRPKQEKFALGTFGIDHGRRLSE